MAATNFSGPVVSQNGFEGNITGTTATVTGTVIFSGLPTSDPNVAGALWANSGVVTVSAG
jgi:hypothetical protein